MMYKDEGADLPLVKRQSPVQSHAVSIQRQEHDSVRAPEGVEGGGIREAR